MKQILYNLLSNAVKFTPDHGSISVSCRTVLKTNGALTSSSGRKIALSFLKNHDPNSTETFIEIAVADTGIGLERSDLERIFEPFESIPSSTNDPYEGTGLGLSVTRKLIELHDGIIWAESRGPGFGSTFYIILPSS